MSPCTANYRRSTQGMTLIELMVVVIILSVLTTLGISGYQKVIYQTRNTEAYEQLGVIRGNQHSHYETFGTYAGANQWVEWPLGPYPLERPMNWGDPPQNSVWQQLGIKPGGDRVPGPNCTDQTAGDQRAEERGHSLKDGPREVGSH